MVKQARVMDVFFRGRDTRSIFVKNQDSYIVIFGQGFFYGREGQAFRKRDVIRGRGIEPMDSPFQDINEEHRQQLLQIARMIKEDDAPRAKASVNSLIEDIQGASKSHEDSALKPCPFCGVDLVRSEFHSNRSVERRTHPGEVSDCIMFGVIISMEDNEDGKERRSAWNRRAATDGVTDEMVDRARNAWKAFKGDNAQAMRAALEAASLSPIPETQAGVTWEDLPSGVTSPVARKAYEHFMRHAEFPASASAMREAIETADRIRRRKADDADTSVAVPARSLRPLLDAIEDHWNVEMGKGRKRWNEESLMAQWIIELRAALQGTS